MTQRFFCGVAVIGLAALLVAPVGAQLTPYTQDFEGMDPTSPTALAEDWLVYGNVFSPDWSQYWYGYGPEPAPNGTLGFSSIIVGEGGPDQGAQQMDVYSDYLNDNHWDGTHANIEANVYREHWITADDLGETWTFKFDAKHGNLKDRTTASAFFKTLDPNGWVLTNYIPLDTTNIPDAWDTYSMSFFIDPGLEGQLFQYGFASVARDGEWSGMLYDNVSFTQDPVSVDFDIRPRSCPNPVNAKSRGVLPVAILGTADLDVAQIDPASLRLEGVEPEFWAYEDIATPFGGEEVCGCTGVGGDGMTDLTVKFSTLEVVGAYGGSDAEDVFTVTGSLYDGTPIVGQDCVVFVGGNRPVVIMQDQTTGFGVFGGTATSEPSEATNQRDSSWTQKVRGAKARKR